MLVFGNKLTYPLLLGTRAKVEVQTTFKALLKHIRVQRNLAHGVELLRDEVVRAALVQSTGQT